MIKNILIILSTFYGLNEDQLQIIYGSYLGDGHISMTEKKDID